MLPAKLYNPQTQLELSFFVVNRQQLNNKQPATEVWALYIQHKQQNQQHFGICFCLWKSNMVQQLVFGQASFHLLCDVDEDATVARLVL